MKALLDELALAGSALSLVEFNVIIYHNIGADYRSMITVLNLHLKPISFQELLGQLVAHELLLKSRFDSPIDILASYSQPLLPMLFNPSFQPIHSGCGCGRSRDTCCGMRNHISIT